MGSLYGAFCLPSGSDVVVMVHPALVAEVAFPERGTKNKFRTSLVIEMLPAALPGDVGRKATEKLPL